MIAQGKLVRTKAPGKEPLPGYRLLEPLGRGGFGEVWKCEVPGGLLKAIKFIAGNPLSPLAPSSAAGQELQALQRIKAIRHPFLLSLERVEVHDGELLIVMELADRSLNDRLLECQGQGMPGIPREELLAYLLETAEVLDVMSFQHGLQHLDIKPSNLFLVGSHIKVADFGLVNTAWEESERSSQCPCGVTPLYASPELLQNHVSLYCDQYSLALVYQDLLTGMPPFRGSNFNDLMMQHLKGQPNLAPLPESERPVVARALAKDPEQRYASCLDFVRALLTASETGGSSAILSLVRARCLLATPGSSEVTVGLASPGQVSRRSEAGLEETPTDDLTIQRKSAVYGILGHELTRFLSENSLGAVYEVRTPEGEECLARFLPGEPSEAKSKVAEAITRLNQLNHPGIAAFEIVRATDGRPVLLTDYPKQTLLDRFQELVAEGHRGIPRAELLAHLGAAAEVLDVLAERHGLFHLNLTPRHLLLEKNRLRIAELGLAQLAQLLVGKTALGASNPYAAPELSREEAEVEPGPGSDQFGLALIFAEMLTGVLPRSVRQGGRPGIAPTDRKLDLDHLPAPDRPILARALDGDPGQRFNSCLDLIEALEAAVPKATGEDTTARNLPSVLSLIHAEKRADGSDIPTVREVVERWLAAATGALAVGSLGRLSYLLRPGNTLESRFPIRMVSMLPLKLSVFSQACGAYTVEHGDGRLVLRLDRPQSFWQRLRGRETGLDIEFRLQSPQQPSAAWHDVVVKVEALEGDALDREEFEELGHCLLSEVAKLMEDNLEQRASTRWPCSLPLEVYPVGAGGKLSEPRTGVARDLSFGGARFHLAEPLESRFFYLRPGGADADEWLVLAEALQTAATPNGGQFVGAAFSTRRK